MKIIIADTSCLILYEKIARFDILKNTFQEITITKEVAEEFGTLPPWIKIVTLPVPNKFIELSVSLGKGEASSISLALETPDSVLILDEKKGRKIARELNIPVLGSLGLLIKAKDKGIISSVREVLGQIEETDFRISLPVKEALLKQAQE